MYEDPVIAKYIDLIKSKQGAIKTFYQGEPLRIANANLPCIVIAKRETTVGPLNNAADAHAMGLTLTVITDVRQDLSSDQSYSEIVEGVATLYDIIEGRNQDYSLKPTSILDILRSNITVDAARNLRTDLGSLTRVDYGTTLRDRTGTYTIEARVDFVATFTQDR